MHPDNFPQPALYVVATPIGNLEDMTFRAVRTLKEVALIACEDTRHTRKLLDHYAIATPLTSYHEHNETERAAELVARMQAGDAVAMVSDAGTPLISDPGYRLVERAIAAGIAVTPVPGACAFAAALSAAGLATDEFHFCGFLPPRAGQRRKAIEAVADEQATLVFYEAPHRVRETLAELSEILGPRQAVVAREVTKLHEQFVRGELGGLAAQVEARGEITILVARRLAAAPSDEPLDAAVKRLEAAGVARMEAMKQVARERGVSKREVYRAVEQAD